MQNSSYVYIKGIIITLSQSEFLLMVCIIYLFICSSNLGLFLVLHVLLYAIANTKCQNLITSCVLLL